MVFRLIYILVPNICKIPSKDFLLLFTVWDVFWQCYSFSFSFVWATNCHLKKLLQLLYLVSCNM